MYRSKINISNRTKQQNKNAIIAHIHRNNLQTCKALKRKIRLDKYIESNEKRQSANNRFKCFFAALDIVKREHSFSSRIEKGKRIFEIYGIAKDGETVKLHIREEIEGKDKILYLISTFYKSEKKASFL